MMKAILAGNYRQYLHWCHVNKCNPRGKDYFYIYDSVSLKGLREFEVVKTGTWYARNDIDAIEREILTQGIK